MAKTKKSPRLLVALLCSKCGAQNYLTERNKINTTEKLKLMKYCHWCKERLEHKETQKLK